MTDLAQRTVIRSIPEGARIVPVVGHDLEPQYRFGDALFVVPVSGYIGEGLYLVELLSGHAEFIQAVRFKPNGPFHVSRPNSRSSYDVSEERFSKIVIGKAVAFCRMIDSHFFN